MFGQRGFPLAFAAFDCIEPHRAQHFKKLYGRSEQTTACGSHGPSRAFCVARSEATRTEIVHISSIC